MKSSVSSQRWLRRVLYFHSGDYVELCALTAVITKSSIFSQRWLCRVLCSHSGDYEEFCVLTAVITKSSIFLQRWLCRVLCSHSGDYVEFYALTAVITKSSIIWDITPCGQVEANLCFGGINCFHLQGVRVSQGRNQNEAGNIFASFALRSWR
jgi:hypothetical protein